jgi:hypothetical protein
VIQSGLSAVLFTSHLNGDKRQEIIEVPFIAPLTLAATLALDSNPSTAYVGTNPIRIAKCSVDPEYNNTFIGDDSIQQIVGSQINVRFVNNAPKAAASVTFAINDGSDSTQIIDTGTFAPGVTIAHSFASAFNDAGDVQCNVTSVAFADGSTWTPSQGDTTAVK